MLSEGRICVPKKKMSIYVILLLLLSHRMHEHEKNNTWKDWNTFVELIKKKGQVFYCWGFFLWKQKIYCRISWMILTCLIKQLHSDRHTIEVNRYMVLEEIHNHISMEGHLVYVLSLPFLKARCGMLTWKSRWCTPRFLWLSQLLFWQVLHLLL